jgi:Uncharacterized protein conserved in bacteria (DUF2188)
VLPSDKRWRVEVEGSGRAESSHTTKVAAWSRARACAGEEVGGASTRARRQGLGAEYIRARPAPQEGLGTLGRIRAVRQGQRSASMPGQTPQRDRRASDPEPRAPRVCIATAGATP